MFSSLNFLFLLSLGITSWILLCITNHQQSNYSDWRQAFEEYKEKINTQGNGIGISIDPPLLPKNKSTPLSKTEASRKLTENLSDYGTFQYSKNIKTPSFFTREQFSRISLLCPFILAIFVIYNIVIGKIKQITYLAVKERAISRFERESIELKHQNRKLLVLINKFKDENNRLIDRLKKDMEEIQAMKSNTTQWREIYEQLHKLTTENTEVEMKRANEKIKERKANRIFEIFRDIASSSTNLLKSRSAEIENVENDKSKEYRKFSNVVTTEELEIIKGLKWE